MNYKKFVRIQNNYTNDGSTKAPRQAPNKLNVLAYFHAYLQASIRSAVEDVGIQQPSIPRILGKNRWQCYELNRIQAITPRQLPQSVEFCEMLLMSKRESNCMD